MSEVRAKSHRVLAVDDEEAILRGYSSVLALGSGNRDQTLENLEAELFGDSVDPDPEFPIIALDMRSSGTAGVDAVREAMAAGDPYSIVYMDVRMPPGQSGVDAALEIRKLDPNVEIVFVTAYADFEAQVKALEIKPIEKLFYINKPFEGDHMWDLTIALCQKWSGRELTAPTSKAVLREASFSSWPIMDVPIENLRAVINQAT